MIRPILAYLYNLYRCDLCSLKAIAAIKKHF